MKSCFTILAVLRFFIQKLHILIFFLANFFSKVQTMTKFARAQNIEVHMVFSFECYNLALMFWLYIFRIFCMLILVIFSFYMSSWFTNFKIKFIYFSQDCAAINAVIFNCWRFYNYWQIENCFSWKCNILWKLFAHIWNTLNLCSSPTQLQSQLVK